MKANELRIGNWVQLYRYPTDKDKSYRFITSIDNEKSELNDGFLCSHSGLEPIPLTEDVRLQFPLWFYNLTSGGYFNLSNLPKEYAEVKLLHTAQNLYFALTGEELTIKL